MRAPPLQFAFSILLAALALGAHAQSTPATTPSTTAAAAAAQTPAPAAPIEQSTVPQGRYEQKAERIHTEDSSVAIDELKVGGETKSVTVQPKNSKLPEYEILQPRSNRAAGAISRDGSDGAQQPRVWSLKKF